MASQDLLNIFGDTTNQAGCNNENGRDVIKDMDVVEETLTNVDYSINTSIKSCDEPKTEGPQTSEQTLLSLDNGAFVHDSGDIATGSSGSDVYYSNNVPIAKQQSPKYPLDSWGFEKEVDNLFNLDTCGRSEQLDVFGTSVTTGVVVEAKNSVCEGQNALQPSISNASVPGSGITVSPSPDTDLLGLNEGTSGNTKNPIVPFEDVLSSKKVTNDDILGLFGTSEVESGQHKGAISMDLLGGPLVAEPAPVQDGIPSKPGALLDFGMAENDTSSPPLGTLSTSNKHDFLIGQKSNSLQLLSPDWQSPIDDPFAEFTQLGLQEGIIEKAPTEQKAETDLSEQIPGESIATEIFDENCNMVHGDADGLIDDQAPSKSPVNLFDLSDSIVATVVDTGNISMAVESGLDFIAISASPSTVTGEGADKDVGSSPTANGADSKNSMDCNEQDVDISMAAESGLDFFAVSTSPRAVTGEGADKDVAIANGADSKNSMDCNEQDVAGSHALLAPVENTLMIHDVDNNVNDGGGVMSIGNNDVLACNEQPSKTDVNAENSVLDESFMTSHETAHPDGRIHSQSSNESEISQCAEFNQNAVLNNQGLNLEPQNDAEQIAQEALDRILDSAMMNNVDDPLGMQAVGNHFPNADEDGTVWNVMEYLLAETDQKLFQANEEVYRNDGNSSADNSNDFEALKNIFDRADDHQENLTYTADSGAQNAPDDLLGDFGPVSGDGYVAEGMESREKLCLEPAGPIQNPSSLLFTAKDQDQKVSAVSNAHSDALHVFTMCEPIDSAIDLVGIQNTSSGAPLQSNDNTETTIQFKSKQVADDITQVLLNSVSFETEHVGNEMDKLSEGLSDAVAANRLSTDNSVEASPSNDLKADITKISLSDLESDIMSASTDGTFNDHATLPGDKQQMINDTVTCDSVNLELHAEERIPEGINEIPDGADTGNDAASKTLAFSGGSAGISKTTQILDEDTDTNTSGSMKESATSSAETRISDTNLGQSADLLFISGDDLLHNNTPANEKLNLDVHESHMKACDDKEFDVGEEISALPIQSNLSDIKPGSEKEVLHTDIDTDIGETLQEVESGMTETLLDQEAGSINIAHNAHFVPAALESVVCEADQTSMPPETSYTLAQTAPAVPSRRKKLKHHADNNAEETKGYTLSGVEATQSETRYDLLLTSSAVVSHQSTTHVVEERERCIVENDMKPERTEVDSAISSAKHCDLYKEFSGQDLNAADNSGAIVSEQQQVIGTITSTAFEENANHGAHQDSEVQKKSIHEEFEVITDEDVLNTQLLSDSYLPSQNGGSQLNAMMNPEQNMLDHTEPIRESSEHVDIESLTIYSVIQHDTQIETHGAEEKANKHDFETLVEGNQPTSITQMDDKTETDSPVGIGKSKELLSFHGASGLPETEAGATVANAPTMEHEIVFDTNIFDTGAEDNSPAFQGGENSEESLSLCDSLEDDTDIQPSLISEQNVSEDGEFSDVEVTHPDTEGVDSLESSQSTAEASPQLSFHDLDTPGALLPTEPIAEAADAIIPIDSVTDSVKEVEVIRMEGDQPDANVHSNHVLGATDSSGNVVDVLDSCGAATTEYNLGTDVSNPPSEKNFHNASLISNFDMIDELPQSDGGYLNENQVLAMEVDTVKTTMTEDDSQNFLPAGSMVVNQVENLINEVLENPKLLEGDITAESEMSTVKSYDFPESSEHDSVTQTELQPTVVSKDIRYNVESPGHLNEEKQNDESCDHTEKVPAPASTPQDQPILDKDCSDIPQIASAEVAPPVVPSRRKKHKLQTDETVSKEKQPTTAITQLSMDSSLLDASKGTEEANKILMVDEEFGSIKSGPLTVNDHEQIDHKLMTDGQFSLQDSATSFAVEVDCVTSPLKSNHLSAANKDFFTGINNSSEDLQEMICLEPDLAKETDRTLSSGHEIIDVTFSDEMGMGENFTESDKYANDAPDVCEWKPVNIAAGNDAMEGASRVDEFAASRLTTQVNDSLETETSNFPQHTNSVGAVSSFNGHEIETISLGRQTIGLTAHVIQSVDSNGDATSIIDADEDKELQAASFISYDALKKANAASSLSHNESGTLDQFEDRVFSTTGRELNAGDNEEGEVDMASSYNNKVLIFANSDGSSKSGLEESNQNTNSLKTVETEKAEVEVCDNHEHTQDQWDRDWENGNFDADHSQASPEIGKIEPDDSSQASGIMSPPSMEFDDDSYSDGTFAGFPASITNQAIKQSQPSTQHITLATVSPYVSSHSYSSAVPSSVFIDTLSDNDSEDSLRTNGSTSSGEGEDSESDDNLFGPPDGFDDPMLGFIQAANENDDVGYHPNSPYVTSSVGTPFTYQGFDSGWEDIEHSQAKFVALPVIMEEPEPHETEQVGIAPEDQAQPVRQAESQHLDITKEDSYYGEDAELFGDDDFDQIIDDVGDTLADLIEEVISSETSYLAESHSEHGDKDSLANSEEDTFIHNKDEDDDDAIQDESFKMGEHEHNDSNHAAFGIQVELTASNYSTADDQLLNIPVKDMAHDSEEGTVLTDASQTGFYNHNGVETPGVHGVDQPESSILELKDENETVMQGESESLVEKSVNEITTQGSHGTDAIGEPIEPGKTSVSGISENIDMAEESLLRTEVAGMVEYVTRQAVCEAAAEKIQDKPCHKNDASSDDHDSLLDHVNRGVVDGDIFQDIGDEIQIANTANQENKTLHIEHSENDVLQHTGMTSDHESDTATYGGAMEPMHGSETATQDSPNITFQSNEHENGEIPVSDESMSMISSYFDVISTKNTPAVSLLTEETLSSAHTVHLEEDYPSVPDEFTNACSASIGERDNDLDANLASNVPNTPPNSPGNNAFAELTDGVSPFSTSFDIPYPQKKVVDESQSTSEEVDKSVPSNDIIIPPPPPTRRHKSRMLDESKAVDDMPSPTDDKSMPPPPPARKRRSKNTVAGAIKEVETDEPVGVLEAEPGAMPAKKKAPNPPDTPSTVNYYSMSDEALCRPVESGKQQHVDVIEPSETIVVQPSWQHNDHATLPETQVIQAKEGTQNLITDNSISHGSGELKDSREWKESVSATSPIVSGEDGLLVPLPTEKPFKTDIATVDGESVAPDLAESSDGIVALEISQPPAKLGPQLVAQKTSCPSNEKMHDSETVVPGNDDVASPSESLADDQTDLQSTEGHTVILATEDIGGKSSPNISNDSPDENMLPKVPDDDLKLEVPLALLISANAAANIASTSDDNSSELPCEDSESSELKASDGIAEYCQSFVLELMNQAFTKIRNEKPLEDSEDHGDDGVAIFTENKLVVEQEAMATVSDGTTEHTNGSTDVDLDYTQVTRSPGDGSEDAAEKIAMDRDYDGERKPQADESLTFSEDQTEVEPASDVKPISYMMPLKDDDVGPTNDLEIPQRERHDTSCSLGSIRYLTDSEDEEDENQAEKAEETLISLDDDAVVDEDAPETIVTNFSTSGEPQTTVLSKSKRKSLVPPSSLILSVALDDVGPPVKQETLPGVPIIKEEINPSLNPEKASLKSVDLHDGSESDKGRNGSGDTLTNTPMLILQNQSEVDGPQPVIQTQIKVIKQEDIIPIAPMPSLGRTVLWESVTVKDVEYKIDGTAIQPYKRVISHGGFYDLKSPIIEIFASYLPSNNLEHYAWVMDNLFLYVLATIELLAQEKFSIVIFVGSTPKSQIPANSLLKRWHQHIDYRLKKNVEAFYIVNPTLYFRTMARIFVSRKVLKKLKYIKSMTELKTFIPTEFLFVPSEIAR